ncbi:hypothetical protein EMIT0P44_120133 [Pseudomonas sp. IT-P44]|jgi:hypothetical protein
MWEMYGYLSAVLTTRLRSSLHLLHGLSPMMANRLDAQEVAQSTEQILRFHCTTSG